ncbi:hypothetical protein N8J89_36180 [Crossiella sp. CA-258035]|uniref:hypothetical protein n=1 Tax=Crossiella sp. CA-258035 TaxID=2981138 RepID=UPI0024BD4F43|nr:hypothetical protein [Crossiella sp. CA-258035]WHT18494.1 hypothetical protein N8J89_36180 [Crossiella sp. CA-258035]
MGEWPKNCANCGVPMPGRANTGDRGPDIAYFVHCRPCAALVAGQMDLLEAEPNGAKIRIYGCRRCGTTRAFRATWKPRCPVCLDERTRGLGIRLLAERRARGIVLARSAEYEWPGWTLLAGDYWGLPWNHPREAGKRVSSHGFWGRHQACGMVALLKKVRVECRFCPAEPGSRTHHARRHDPHLLYLVEFQGLLKFGHGNAQRIRTHQLEGAEVRLVLQATHAEVVAAERVLKKRHRELLVPRGTLLPHSFGRGTEVVAAGVPVDLAEVLLRARDVTDRFR